MVVAGVFMSFSDSHGLGLLSPAAFLSYALALLVVLYLAKITRDLWLNRRENCFDAFCGRDVFPYYKDREKVGALFFKRNPLPYWSILSRSFGYDDLTADELATTLPPLDVRHEPQTQKVQSEVRKRYEKRCDTHRVSRDASIGDGPSAREAGVMATAFDAAQPPYPWFLIATGQKDPMRTALMHF